MCETWVWSLGWEDLWRREQLLTPIFLPGDSHGQRSLEGYSEINSLRCLEPSTVVMYGCESWTIKKAEYLRIDAFELWCWRRLLRVPWTARRSNLSILKGISPEYSLEGLMLKLKLQHFGHLMWRTDSLEKILMLGKIWRKEKKGTTEDEKVGGHHQFDGPEFEQASGVGDGQRSLMCCSP